MMSLREAVEAQAAVLAARRETFTNTLRRRVISDTIVTLIEEAARFGKSKANLDFPKIREAFLGANPDPTDLLEKVLLWSHEDPKDWDLSFIRYDFTTREGRLKLSEELHDMVLSIKGGPGVFQAVIKDLAPDYEAAGYTLEHKVIMEDPYHICVLSGW